MRWSAGARHGPSPSRIAAASGWYASRPCALARRGPRDSCAQIAARRAVGHGRRTRSSARPAAAPPQLDPARHYLEGTRRRRRDVPRSARHDQLRLGLVSRRCASARACPATSRSPGRWPTASAPTAPWTNARAARDAHRGDRRHARPGPRPRAHGALRPGAARARPVPRRARARSTLVREARGSAERLAEHLATGMALFDDRGFYKRAQIVPRDLALARRRRVPRPRPPHDLRRQPRPPRPALRRRARLRPAPRAHIDAGRPLRDGPAGARDPRRARCTRAS